MAADPGYEVSSTPLPNGLSVSIRGRIEIANVQKLRAELANMIGDQDLHLDLSEVTYFDSGGGALLLHLRRASSAAGRHFVVTKSTPDIEGFRQLLDEDALLAPPAPPHPRPNPLSRLGQIAIDGRTGIADIVSFSGEMVIGLGQAILHPTKIRWRETWDYMARSGQDALPIVALISFLMGLITAFQAAVQLQQFGADIYIANLVGLSITRELGPLMTAIIAAGRSGAAFAAEIGTMKVSEEVDALAAMGLDRTRFLVTPKLIALVLMLPCLTLFADLVGILGGLVVANVGLEIPAQVYFRQMTLFMDFGDIRLGLIKSIVFAILIAGVGCLRGFQARGGAESVGRITTSAIVSGIFSIVVADAVFTVLTHEW